MFTILAGFDVNLMMLNDMINFLYNLLLAGA